MRGVIARESMVPLNNPGLWRALPKYMLNRGAKLRYRLGYVLANARWTAGFLANATPSRTERTVEALDALLDLSRRLHGEWMRDAELAHRLRENGWLDLHRSAESLAGAESETAVFDRLGLAYEVLDRAALSDLEPHIAPGFAGAVWSKDAASVDHPGAVVKGYAADAARRGAEIRQNAVKGLTRRETGWDVVLEGETIAADAVVVAMGTWSGPLLAGLGIRARLANERGYHRHFRAEGNAVLGRPFYDTSGGYAMAPMEMGIRVTSGVELAATDAPPKHAQIELAEAAARRAFPLAERLEETPWMGRRPTTPDSRPVIGQSRQPGLWLAYGHQHIGFTTGPGTARLLAELMTGEAPSIDPEPFAPGRFGI